jgi:hypothetical protein
MHRAVGVAFVMTGCALGMSLFTTTARADQFLIAKNTTSDAIAVYRRTTTGWCSKTVVTPYSFSDPNAHFYDVHGTSGNDVMVAYTRGAALNWCGYTNILPLKPLASKNYLTILGDNGQDVIWGGNGGSFLGLKVCGGIDCSGFGANSDDSTNFIFVGSSSAQGGPKSDYIIDLNGGSASGGSGDDLFCSAVPGVSSSTAVILSGDDGNDTRSGPAAVNETSIELTSTTMYQDQCSFVYTYMNYSVTSMLSS